MILFVEENHLVASVVCETLEAEGLATETCRNAATALTRIENGEHFDVIVFGQVLVGMMGPELLCRIRRLEHQRRTAIIVFSASSHESEALDAGADAFLRKPEEISKLAPTVRRLIGSMKKESLVGNKSE